MPLRFGKNSVVFEEVCAVEEALPLLEFLHATPGARVNLRACIHMHTAILQVLMAVRPKISALPEEDFLRRWLTPLLAPLLVKKGAK